MTRTQIANRNRQILRSALSSPLPSADEQVAQEDAMAELRELVSYPEELGFMGRTVSYGESTIGRGATPLEAIRAAIQYMDCEINGLSGTLRA